jgi:hypothetical protein
MEGEDFNAGEAAGADWAATSSLLIVKRVARLLDEHSGDPEVLLNRLNASAPGFRIFEELAFELLGVEHRDHSVATSFWETIATGRQGVELDDWEWLSGFIHGAVNHARHRRQA